MPYIGHDSYDRVAISRRSETYRGPIGVPVGTPHVPGHYAYDLFRMTARQIRMLELLKEERADGASVVYAKSRKAI